MRVFIFSYNRGAYLRNAVESVRRHMPFAQVTVMDDRSDDPDTRAVLAALPVEVLTAPAPGAEHAVTGGLHGGMNRALDLAEAEGQTVVLMLQDDMMLVRDVAQADLDAAVAQFDRADASFVLGVTFAKTRRGARDIGLVLDGGVYRRPEAAAVSGAHCAYGDTGLFHIPRLRATLGRLEQGEKENEARARALGLRMGSLVFPFAHWLPFPVSWRGRKRVWRLRLLDLVCGAGVHVIAPLQGERLRRFLDRDPGDLPFAEDWLTAPTAPQALYWSLRGGAQNGLARGGWRSTLARRLR
ncbi:MAG: glycosyltransferase family A protein [Salipiger marinus]|uniref:glycosyltransferase family A protein n=1 Tax=Salipiger marinus TaxID=555512 RepID=UPI00405893AF